MKKIITLVASISFAHVAFAQNSNANANSQWRINGNSASTTDFIGTTNNQSLVFKTNNIARATFDTQGKTIFDGGGEVIIHPGGLNRPILSNPIAAYMLKVGGSGHFDGELNSRQLFVQEHITYMKSLKGPRIDVDSIRMDSTRGIFGNTKIFGDVQIKQNLEVIGETTLKGNLTAEKGFTFDGINGVDYTPNSSGGGTFRFGKLTNPKKVLTSCAAGPQSSKNYAFDGWMQIFDGSNQSTSGILNFQTFGARSYIDASQAGNTGGGSALLVNYFCGNDVGICTGQYGGHVYLGTTHVGPMLINAGAHTDAKLTVDGKMVAKSCYITINNWADYVFAKDYKLPNLYDIEKYYLANQHLPEVPTEKEVIENGIDVGEMNKILLKKIEEITILMVKQQKEIDALKQLNNK